MLCHARKSVYQRVQPNRELCGHAECYPDFLQSHLNSFVQGRLRWERKKRVLNRLNAKEKWATWKIKNGGGCSGSSNNCCRWPYEAEVWFINPIILVMCHIFPASKQASTQTKPDLVRFGSQRSHLLHERRWNYKHQYQALIRHHRQRLYLSCREWKQSFPTDLLVKGDRRI